MRYHVRVWRKREDAEPLFTVELPRQHLAAKLADKLCQLLITSHVVEIYDADEDKVLNRWEFISPFKWICK